MKYFTPELYLRLNSRDRSVVEQAHAEWEDALERYREHLAKIKRKLTPSVRKLADTLSLHDASYRGVHWPGVTELDETPAFLAVRRANKLLLLVYFLAEEPLIQEVKQQWPFSRENVHWLYDEFSLAEDSVQQHDVLLSNGRTITLRFFELKLIEHEVHQRSSVA